MVSQLCVSRSIEEPVATPETEIMLNRRRRRKTSKTVARCASGLPRRGASHLLRIERDEVLLVEIAHQPIARRQMLHRKRSCVRLPQLAVSSHRRVIKKIRNKRFCSFGPLPVESSQDCPLAALRLRKVSVTSRKPRISRRLQGNHATFRGFPQPENENIHLIFNTLTVHLSDTE